MLSSPPSHSIFLIFHTLAMSSQNQSTPDLATVLKTLAALNSQNHQNQSENPDSESIMAPDSPPYEPAPATIPAPTLDCFIPKPAKPATSSKDAAQSKFIDATTIIDWPTGLRTVMKTFASNEAIVKDIQRVCIESVILLLVLLNSVLVDQGPARARGTMVEGSRRPHREAEG